MSTKHGTTTINKIYHGTTVINRMYLGTTMVHGSTGGGGGGEDPPDPGGELTPEELLEQIALIGAANHTAAPTWVRDYMRVGFGGPDKWNGAVAATNGNIYMIPYTAPDVCVIDPSANTASRILLDDGHRIVGGDAINKWVGGAQAANGKIYCAPYDALDILIIDPLTMTTTRSAMGADLTGPAKWYGAVLGSNGKIYCVPYGSTDILIIDPTTETATRSQMGVTPNLNGTVKWRGGVAAGDGKIYCTPTNAADILIINPAANTATRSTMGTTLSGSGKWHGGALATDGKIYCPPANATDILVINPGAGTCARNTFGLTFATPGGRFSGAVAASNGNVYCIPMAEPNFCVINTGAGTATLTALGLTTLYTALSKNTKTWGGALGDNGKIYTVPRGENIVRVIDPTAGTAVDTNFGLNDLSIDHKSDSGVLAPNGKIYCVPRGILKMMIIVPEKGYAYWDFDDGSLGPLPHVVSELWGYGGVLAPNGKIYCTPREATDMLIIEPDPAGVDGADTFYRTDFGLTSEFDPPTGDGKWRGAILAGDIMYNVPRDHNKVLRVDTSNDTATATNFGLNMTGDNKWLGGCRSPTNGKIYCLPVAHSKILVIDPSDDTAVLTDFGLTMPSSEHKWTTAVLGPDGKIYGVPNEIPEVIIIDPDTDTAVLSGMGAGIVFGGKWIGGILGPDGKIYCTPFDGATEHVLIIDPLAGVAWQENFGIRLIGSSKWSSGSNSLEGKIYMIARAAVDMLVISPGPGVNPWIPQIALSPYLNKY